MHWLGFFILVYMVALYIAPVPVISATVFSFAWLLDSIDFTQVPYY